MNEAVAREAKFYEDEKGSYPVKNWMSALKKKGRQVEWSKISARIKRAAKGNFGDHRFLAGSMGELRIDIGPGYRVYFGVDGDEFLMLLHGGTKPTQQEDIEIAKTRWEQYQLKKRKENENGK